MRSNRILSVFLCVLMIGSMFASLASAAAPKIGLAISTLNNPFFVDLRDGALEEAKKAGLGITVADAQNDPPTDSYRRWKLHSARGGQHHFGQPLRFCSHSFGHKGGKSSEDTGDHR